MNMKEKIKYCKEKIEEYNNEMQKLEKQKIEYLEVDKTPPKRITKRITECSIIINYFEDLLNKIVECENEISAIQITSNLNIPRFYNIF